MIAWERINRGISGHRVREAALVRVLLPADVPPRLSQGVRVVNGRCIAVLSLLLCVAPAWAAPATPRAAPQFQLPARDGSTVVSDSLRGRVVYVDFWASWCGPCRKSFPWLASLQQRYEKKGLTVVAINLDKDRALADKFLKQYSAPFTVVFDPSGKTAEAFAVRGMPTSFLIDRSGVILSTHVGFDPKEAAAIEARIVEECAK